jgi:hypothetical protein
VPDEEVDALALVVVAVVELDPALELAALELALDELDELLPHAVSTQLTTTSAPNARMGRHPITRISTSLGSLTWTGRDGRAGAWGRNKATVSRPISSVKSDRLTIRLSLR